MSRTSADAVSIHAVLPESSANSDIAIEIHSPLASRAAGSRPTLGPVSYVQSPLVLQACDKEPSRVNVPFRTTGRAGASHQPSRPSTNAAGSNGAKSSGPSPRPTSLTGTPSWRWTCLLYTSDAADDLLC